MAHRYVLISAGIATIAYQGYLIRSLRKKHELLSDAFLEHAETEFQEVVDEQFEEIIENYDD
jgi:tmRNA-binding protein